MDHTDSTQHTNKNTIEKMLQILQNAIVTVSVIIAITMTCELFFPTIHMPPELIMALLITFYAIVLYYVLVKIANTIVNLTSSQSQVVLPYKPTPSHVATIYNNKCQPSVPLRRIVTRSMRKLHSLT